MWPVNLHNLDTYMPSATIVVSISSVIVGLVLWATGAKLLRTVCTAASMVLGGALGYLVARQVGAEHMVGLWVIGGALVGLVLSWVLFMLWVCAGSAALLAAVAPALVLIWQGVQFEVPESISIRDARPMASIAYGHGGDDEYVPEALLNRKVAPQKPKPEGKRVAMLDRLVLAKFGPQVDGLVSWWGGLEVNLRRSLWIAAGIGALIGILGGLLMPQVSAACVSSFAGAMLMLIGGGGILMTLAPRWNQAIEPYPALSIAFLGLITAAGAWLQYRSIKRASNS